MVKVRFELDPDTADGHGSETLWAEPIGQGRYRLRNSPFYAREVSAEDVVFADPVEGSDGTSESGNAPLLFQGVSIRGGHSTYRLLRNANVTDADFQKAWAPLRKEGCTYEEAHPSFFAIDVPANADIYQVYSLLERGASVGIWTFEEGHCGHPLRSSSA